MDAHARIYVAGHRGMVGSALVRALGRESRGELLLRSRDELDLRDQGAVETFFASTRPTHVFLAAATVGGILANDRYPADFLYDNLMIEANVIEAARRHEVTKLLFLGSSCIYPRLAAQPMSEDALLGGPLEPTNQWYAIAKIAGIKLCQAYRRQHGCDFICAMPANLYGPGDYFDLERAHVVPALMRRIHEAKTAGAPSVTVWGSGTPLREFLHVDDLADALLFLMRHYCDERHVNVGAGEDLSIAQLAEMISAVVGYRGTLAFDASKPDGPPRKLVDTRRLDTLGWRPRIGLRDGLTSTYRWFLDNAEALRR